MFMHDAFMDLDCAEQCVQRLSDAQSPATEYELEFNRFLIYLDQAWEKGRTALRAAQQERGLSGRITWSRWEAAYTMRDSQSTQGTADPLLQYLKVARNQLTHRTRVLQLIDAGLSLARPNFVSRPGGVVIRDAKAFVIRVLPSLEIDFVGAHIGLAPVSDQEGKAVAVPTHHLHIPLESADPTTVAKLGLKFYAELLIAARSEFNG